MDYYKIYLKHWQNVIDEKTLQAIDYFKKSKESNRPFLYVLKIFIEQTRKQLNTEVLLPLKKEYPEIFSIFNNRAELAENEQILSVLSNDIKDQYIKDGHNLSGYERIIEKLARYEALNEIVRNLSNHYQYLDLVYKTDMWENFQLEDFDKGYLNDNRYAKMKQFAYPSNEKNKQLSPTPVETNKSTPAKSETQIQYQNCMKAFTENEKKFILYVLAEFHKGEKSILQDKELPFTEFLMALEITKSVYDEKIFYAPPNSISYYTSIRRGIKLAPSGKSKMFLNSLNKKLDSLNFKQLQNLTSEWYTTDKTK
ncbi:hypothetical protein [Maribacter dokdonensis]|uniref:hypothetical protein n=1 Tax=Maribacter dokdonensis TaxID=320912 RepID=UPI001C09C067|nr:hypothetical protein [Maribacter dokdonensis]MBU2901566.1 hypothetical protein [Maribacter dokdonensis]